MWVPSRAGWIAGLLTGQNLQAINEARVRELNELWMTAAQLEQAKLADEQGQAAHVLEEVPRNEPRLDSMMFARHNVPAWTEPADAQFEPSPVWHDEAVMATDEAARVYLRNVLVKSKTSARDLGIEVRNKQSEAQTAARAGGGDALMDERLISLREEVHGLERRRLAAEVETATITAAAGDLSLGARNHNFRSTTFTIPTNCDCCGERIWGLAAKGFDCRDCGYTCHGKCVMKVPAECPGELSKEEKKRLRAQRQEHAGDMPALAASASTGEISDTLDADGGGGGGSGGSDHTASLPDLTQANTVRSQASTPSSPAAAAPEADKPAAARPRRVMAPPPAQFVSGGPRIGGAGAGRRSSSGAAETGAPGGRMLYAYTATGDDEVSVVEGADVVVEERDGKLASPFLGSFFCCLLLLLLLPFFCPLARLTRQMALAGPRCGRPARAADWCRPRTSSCGRRRRRRRCRRGRARRTRTGRRCRAARRRQGRQRQRRADAKAPQWRRGAERGGCGTWWRCTTTRRVAVRRRACGRASGLCWWRATAAGGGRRWSATRAGRRA